MNPDLGSGGSVSYEAHFKHALIQMETGRKTADSPVLREKQVISPRNVSDGESTLQRIYEKIFPATQNSSFEKHPSMKLPGISPDPESGQGIFDHRDIHA